MHVSPPLSHSFFFILSCSFLTLTTAYLSAVRYFGHAVGHATPLTSNFNGRQQPCNFFVSLVDPLMEHSTHSHCYYKLDVWFKAALIYYFILTMDQMTVLTKWILGIHYGHCVNRQLFDNKFTITTLHCGKMLLLCFFFFFFLCFP